MLSEVEASPFNAVLRSKTFGDVANTRCEIKKFYFTHSIATFTFVIR